MATPLGRSPRAASLSNPAGARSRRPARLLRVVLAVTGAVGVLFTAVPAQAAPATSADAAAMVAARGHELEAVTEKFNEARATLDTQRAAAQAAAAQLQQATAALGSAQQQVRGIARSAWTGEGLSSFQALMTSDSATDFVDRMSTLQLVAGHQNGILQAAAGANVAAAQAQAAAEDAAAAAKATYDTVAAQQADLQKQVADYQAVYDRLSAAEKRAASTVPQRASRSDRQPVASGPVVASSQAAQIAVDAALAQRGKPYVWAADGPGSFDCSGLTAYAYGIAGIMLSHSSALQARTGQAVSRADLQPGDLVFFYSPVSHVGIYIGNGQMVHAPTSGDVVKIANVDSMGGFVGGRRIAA
jgi:cell wall-associated NlpC family hydrolase